MKSHFTASLLLLIIPLAAPITFAPITDFSKCTLRTTFLICSNENFSTKFPTISGDITIFHCEQCIIPEVPANTFQNAAKLTSIKFTKIAGSGMLKIDATAFSGAARLREMELENTNLPSSATTVNLASLLSDKNVLITIKITKVLVSSLPARFIGNSVKKVTLDSTGLESIDVNAFSRASDVAELIIANPKRAFSFNFLGALSALKIFQLRGGQSKTFSIPLSVTTLEELDFSRVSFTGIDTQAFGGSVSTLRTFKLEYCNTIQHDKMAGLEKLTNLEVLSFKTSTSITEVPPAVKKLGKLKSLILSGTSIETIKADDLPQFGVLQSLFIEIKVLRILHIDAFDKLKLTELSLNYVNYHSVFLLPKGSSWRSLFAKMSRTLQSLRMVHCKLTDAFWDELSVLSSLQKLALNNNDFTKIKDYIFGNLTSIAHLELDDNKITALDQTSTYGIPISSEINLAYNQIKTIDNCTFANRDISNKVNLNGNPFVCDCNLRWLVKALKTPGKKSLDAKCEADPHKGKKLSELNPADLTCSAGNQLPACIVIPVTTPIPPPPPVSFAVLQDGNNIRVSVNDSLQRWYKYGVVFFSVVGALDAFKTSSVFRISEQSERLEGLENGKSYNICVLISKGYPSIQPSVLQTDGNDRSCDTFLFIAVNVAQVGLIAGLSTMGAILLAVIVVLLLWCWLRKRHPQKKSDPYDDDKESIYETYVYPPSSSIYSPAPASSTTSRPVTRRFVRQSEMSRAGTQSTVLDSAPGASRFDLSRSTVSLAVQNRHTNHSSVMLSGQAAAPDTRKFMSMHDLAAPAKRPSNYIPNASRSMDELGPRAAPARRAPFVPNKERANRSLPNPNQEEYAYIEEGEEYSKTPTPKSPQSPSNEYLKMGDTDSQYMSMSSAHSLDQNGPTKPADEGYGPVVTPTDTYGPPTPHVEVRGASQRPHRATESQLSLVNNRESAEEAHYNNRPSNVNISSTDIGSF